MIRAALAGTKPLPAAAAFGCLVVGGNLEAMLLRLRNIGHEGGLADALPPIPKARHDSGFSIC